MGGATTAQAFIATRGDGVKPLFAVITTELHTSLLIVTSICSGMKLITILSVFFISSHILFHCSLLNVILICWDSNLMAAHLLIFLGTSELSHSPRAAWAKHARKLHKYSTCIAPIHIIIAIITLICMMTCEL